MEYDWSMYLKLPEIEPDICSYHKISLSMFKLDRPPKPCEVLRCMPLFSGNTAAVHCRGCKSLSTYLGKTTGDGETGWLEHGESAKMVTVSLSGDCNLEHITTGDVPWYTQRLANGWIYVEIGCNWRIHL